MTLQRSAETRTCRREVVGTTDRRNLPRMLLDQPVLCSVEGETIEARAKSISGEGMLLELDRLVVPETVMEVRIGPPLTPNRPFRAEMVVTRTEEVLGLGGTRHRVAGRFVRPATY